MKCLSLLAFNKKYSKFFHKVEILVNYKKLKNRNILGAALTQFIKEIQYNKISNKNLIIKTKIKNININK